VTRPSWAETWAVARTELGLELEQYLDMTPRMLHLLLKHSRQLLSIADRQHGNITAAIYNTAPWPLEETAKAENFMILPQISVESKEKEPVDVGAKLMSIFGMPLS
jgi:hypothetical protein